MNRHDALTNAWKIPGAQPGGGRARRVVARARPLVTAGALLYALGTLLLAMLWSAAPERWWWLEATNLFAPLFFAPLLALIPLTLLLRSRWLLLATTIAALSFAALFGGLFIPRQPPADVGQPRLRVATLNAWRDNDQPGVVVQAIREAQPDIVALQELSPSMADAIGRELRAEYPYQQWNQTFGLISRHPIAWSGRPGTVRGQLITARVDGRTVRVVNVHLHRERLPKYVVPGLEWLPIPRGYSSDVQQSQVRDLLAQLDEIPQPFVLMGDFNLGDRDPKYAALASHLTDAYRTASTGFGFTYPSTRTIGPITVPFPLLRIDYIWTSQGLAPQAARVSCATGSDHCMVVADLLLNE